MKRAVFMGTPDFAVPPLKALIDAPDICVKAVFTQPDKPKGRGNSVQMSPVKELALAHEIPVYQPRRVREESAVSVLRTLSPDVIIVVAFGQIIPREILELPRFGCLNVHASLLPAYRGAAPVQWAVIDGAAQTGVTIMQMNEGLDTGDIISVKKVLLAPDETGGSLFDRLSVTGTELLMETLPSVFDGTAQRIPQPQESPTHYASMLKKADGRVSWEKDAVQIERLVRGMNPWPSAYTTRGSKTLKLWKTAVISQEQAERAGIPDVQERRCGEVVYVDKSAVWIKTGNGILSLLELQPEGKKRMTADAYLRGYPVKEGEILGL